MAKKSILGEFLNSDIKSKTFDNKIENIHYKKIKRPRKNRELRRIEELAEDIREDGLENNLLVRRIVDEDYDVELIGGERRYTAILMNIESGDMTYEYIPCKVVSMSELDARRRLILNNHENDPLTTAEKLEAVEELREIYRIKKEEAKNGGEPIPGRIQQIIANEMGLKKSQIANYEKIINRGSDKVRDSIKKEEITLDAAVTLVDLNEEEQEKFLKENDSYSKKAIELFKEELKKEHEANVEKQLYYNENNEIQEVDITKFEVDCNGNMKTDKDILDDNSVIFIKKENHIKTIDEIMTDIVDSMYKLREKLNGVEFRDEYAQFQKAQIEINKLMEQLGLVYSAEIQESI